MGWRLPEAEASPTCSGHSRHKAPLWFGDVSAPRYAYARHAPELIMSLMPAPDDAEEEEKVMNAEFHALSVGLPQADEMRTDYCVCEPREGGSRDAARGRPSDRERPLSPARERRQHYPGRASRHATCDTDSSSAAPGASSRWVQSGAATIGAVESRVRDAFRTRSHRARSRLGAPAPMSAQSTRDEESLAGAR